MADHDPTCQRCGDALDPVCLDVRVTLPDQVLALGEHDRAGSDRTPLLHIANVGTFVRCLLPVHLSTGMMLTFGTWLSVSHDDFAKAQTVWHTPDYQTLELTGTLANAIKPWGNAIFDAPARIAVCHPSTFLTSSAAHTRNFPKSCKTNGPETTSSHA